MNKLATLSLAAGAAFLPSSALAMQGGHADSSGGAAGVSWQADAAAPALADGTAPVAVQAAAAQGMHQVHRFPHHRVHRGWRMPPFWVGPRFRIMNWRHYGFAPPPSGGWWIRYYDDALLVGPDGVIRDGRYDVEWDRYGERWERDVYGVPSYVGSGDYAPDSGDYAWVDSHEGRPGEGWAHGAPPSPGYGHGHGYSYGYGYGPVVVTETVTTTGPAYAHKGHHGKRVVTHRKMHHHDGARCDCPEHAPPPPPQMAPPPPPPPSGERG